MLLRGRHTLLLASKLATAGNQLLAIAFSLKMNLSDWCGRKSQSKFWSAAFLMAAIKSKAKGKKGFWLETKKNNLNIIMARKLLPILC